jgi:vancomycin resistance protein YoaR
LGLVAAFSLVALLVAASLLVYGATHSHSIYSGTRAAGADLGGKSRADAQATLEQRLSAYAQQPLTFTANGQTLQATPAQLGLTFDTQAMADNAYQFGRDSNLWTDSRHWLDALAGGHTVPVVVNVDSARFEAFFAQHAAGIAVAPRDATFGRDAAGRTTVDAGAPGVALDLNATLQTFEKRANSLSSAPVEIATISIPPAVSDAKLQGALKQVSQLVDEPLTLALDGSAWQIDSTALSSMLAVDTSQDEASVHIDRVRLRQYVATLEHDAFTPGVNASITNTGGTFTTTKAAPGHKLDIDASTDVAMAALQSDAREAQLVTMPVQPQVSDDAVNAALAQAQQLTSQDVTLTWDGGTQTIAAAKLANALRFDVNPGRNPVVKITWDTTEMEHNFALAANNVKVAPKDADLRWIDGVVQVKTPEVNGRELDVNASIDALTTALAGGTTQIAVLTKDVKPLATAAMAPTIQIRDQLAVGQTYYGDSAADRLFNVELAANRANGALVPPGGTFSFDAALGEVSYASGYRTGYGIVATDGNITTIPSVGGGICQVATTAFQAAFHAGMPVVERNWHFYWIPRYGVEPYGQQGLDATVDPDYGLDMQFKNTTNDWLAYKVILDGGYVRFELWGTNPGWDVQVDPTVVTNVVTADQSMHYENNDQLPAGTTVFVEHAEDGFDAAVHRVVRKDGQVIDDTTLNAHYEPAVNTTLIGTGG